MAETSFTFDQPNDRDLKLIEHVSGHVFHFRLIDGALDLTSDLVEPSSNPEAKPHEFYRVAAVEAAKAYLALAQQPFPRQD